MAVCEMHVWERRTLASSLTPWRLTPWMQRDLCSSFMVMGLEGSRRPWSIHDCMRSRLMGDISTLKLRVRQFPLHLCLFALHWHFPSDNSRIVFAPAPLWVGDGLRRLPTLEACWHLSVCMLALLASSSRLALARRRTATAADLLVVCALVVRQRRENRRASLLCGHEQRLGGGCSGASCPGRDGQEREGEARGLQPGRHVGWRAAVGCVGRGVMLRVPSSCSSSTPCGRASRKF
jgi:hypothetical protein